MRRFLQGLFALTCALVVVSGCGPSGTPTPARVRPTSIPRPTPLPPLPTAPPPGSSENPIQIILVSSRASSLEEEAAALAETISSETDLTINVTVTDDYGVALKAFCAGQAGLISTNAFGYLAAQESGCGEGIYAAEVDGATATQGQLLAGFGRDIFTVEGFEGYRFCRPGPDSVNGWVVPALAMRAAGINPLTDLFSVTDSGSDRAVVEQMISFRCDIGASALGAEEGVSGNDGVFVVEELPQVPNDTVMISGHLSEITKAIITDSIRAHLPELVELVNADSLIEVDDAAFTSLRDLFTSAGISPASMGK